MRIFKFGYLIFKGIGYKESKFFSKWNMIAQFDILKKFRIKNNYILHIPSGKIFPKSIDYLVSCNLIYLEEYITVFNGSYKENYYFVNLSLLDRKDIRVKIYSPGHLFALREIFSEGTYSMALNENTHYTLIDVGLNIGLASLYFSCYDQIDCIYGFEMIPSTFNLATDNIALNPKLAEKIFIENSGWDVKEYSRIVYVNEIGSVTNTIAYSENLNGIAEKCFFVDSLISIDSIIQKNPNRKLIVKMDCEGAELLILNHLDEYKGFNMIEVMLIEWHDYNSNKVIEVLKKNNFNAFLSPSPKVQGTGMIYAFKNN